MLCYGKLESMRDLVPDRPKRRARSKPKKLGDHREQVLERMATQPEPDGPSGS